MTHEMHLHELPFNQINAGLKTIESRLNDEKRQEFKVGDLIKIYKRPEAVEFVIVKITDLHVHKNFEELFAISLPQVFGGEGMQDLIESIYKYYSKEDEAKYGVVGIEFEKIAE